MTIERSDKVFENWRQAAEKFDYFILGVTGALCAYISQSYKPVRLGLNSGTLELTALVLLVFAAIAGFKRIERTVEVTHLNHRILRAYEERGALIATTLNTTIVNEATGELLSPQVAKQRIESLSLSIPQLRVLIEVSRKVADLSYHLRNWLILVGFTVLVTAKVLSAYV